MISALLSPVGMLSNYNITYNTANFTINRAPLTVTADNKSREFGDANPLLTGSITGIKNNDAISASYSTTADATSLAGSYDIVPQLSGAALSNYEVAINKGTLTIRALTFKGFFQPVDMNGVLNTVKNGSTVPLKFEVFKGTTELTDTSIVSALSKQITCGTGAVDDIEVVATGNTSLRYDTTAGQFVYNWKTPSVAGNCYSVTMTAKDGSTITAFFKLK